MFQTIHPTLVTKSVPQFWHKGVGKANHVIETKKKEKREKEETSKSASGGEKLQGASESRF